MDNSFISIIVPTYKEAKNIPTLVEEIDKNMRASNYPYEVVIIDDNSQDGIIEVINRLKTYYNIKLQVRKEEKGLSSAVLAGFHMAQGDILVVMDADLSHPPDKISELVNQILHNKKQFAIGSRFVKGGSAPYFTVYRRINAYISKILARPLTSVKDPMAGFFAFRKSILNNGDRLNPLGFKIGLEIIVKFSPKNIVEIPIKFQERLFGESKLSIREQIKYVIHLKRLYEYKFQTLLEIVLFSLIGCTGMIVDLLFTYISKDVLAFSFPIARVIGFVFGLTNNFFLNRQFTFKATRKSNMSKQYILFFCTALLAFSINLLISVYLYYKFIFFHQHYLIASFIGILGGLTVNFVGSKYIVFKVSNKKCA